MVGGSVGVDGVGADGVGVSAGGIGADGIGGAGIGYTGPLCVAPHHRDLQVGARAGTAAPRVAALLPRPAPAGPALVRLVRPAPAGIDQPGG